MDHTINNTYNLQNSSINNWNYITNDEINSLFEKKFQYKNTEEWKLPKPNEIFQEFYQFSNLQKLKTNLENVKGQLGIYNSREWHKHTSVNDPGHSVPWYLRTEIKGEFVTIAWTKLFECLNSYPLVNGPKLNSVHLCEAPGAFTASLNHYLYSKYSREEIIWNWIPTTYNPYYEGNELDKMIIDERFILHTFDQWEFHNDFTGDILSLSNIEQLTEVCQKRLSSVDLITADGSIDCEVDPVDQEIKVSKLHIAEIICALNVLSHGGNFLIKKFTLFESSSVSIMYLLNCAFKQVHVFKPATSRRANSEVYIICLYYKSDTQYLKEILNVMKTQFQNDNLAVPIFCKSHLPNDFLAQHELCVELFFNLQRNAIVSNIRAFDNTNRRAKLRQMELTNLFRYEYLRRYQVKSIPDEVKILYKSKASINKKCIAYYGDNSNKTRREIKTASLVEQLIYTQKVVNDMEKLISNNNSLTSYDDKCIFTTGAIDNNANDDQNIEMKLYNGKPYEQLNSSVFILTNCLKITQTIEQLFSIDVIWSNPACVLDNRPVCILDNQVRIYFTFEKNVHYIQNFYNKQREFFLNIITSILDEENVKRCEQIITFKDFPFLSHYSVSLLYYLYLRIFKHLTISIEKNIFEIILKRSQTLSIEQIEILKSLRNLISDENRNILCFLPIMKLHSNEFSDYLEYFNNNFILRNCQKYISTFC